MMIHLLLFTAAGIAIARAACSNALIPDFNPTCSNQERSFCSRGDIFENMDMSSISRYDVAVQYGIQRRKEATELANAKALDLKQALYSDKVRRDLFADKSDNEMESVLNDWLRFLGRLIDIAEKTKLRNEGTGFCGEAAKASIAQSIWKQLVTGKRESIQFVQIFGHSDVLGNSAHNFVIYNSAPIGEHNNIDNTRMAFLMNGLQPQDRDNPRVIVCDSWVDYHGKTGRWHEHFINKVDKTYRAVQWNRLLATDMSIPRFREDLTPKQRKFFVNIMRRILDPVVVNNATLPNPRGRNSMKHA